MLDENPLPEGGDTACWLDRTCPECGHLEDGEPPDVCPRCGFASAGRAEASRADEDAPRSRLGRTPGGAPPP